MRKLTFFMFIVLLMGITGYTIESGWSAETPGVTDTSIKLGAWIPLTGPIAVHGLAQKAGVDAFFGMINDKGGVKGRKINWIVEDNAYDPQKTVAAARKLIARDEIFAFVGCNGTAQSAAAFSFVLEESKVPIFIGQGGALSWYNPSKPYLYGAMVVYEYQAQVLGQWAAKEGTKKLLVVHSDPAAFENVANNYKTGAESINPNLTTTLMAVKLNTRDYVPIVLQIANAKPDAVGTVLPTGEVVALAKEMARQNVKLPIYTYSPNVSFELIELAGEAADGLRAVSYTVPPTIDTPAVAEYRSAMKQYVPDAKPDFQSLFTWAEAKVFVEALNRIQGELTRENLVASLNKMSNFETGILPPVTFNETNHMGVTGVQRVMVEKGGWKLIGGFVDATSKW